MRRLTTALSQGLPGLLAHLDIRQARHSIADHLKKRSLQTSQRGKMFFMAANPTSKCMASIKACAMPTPAQCRQHERHKLTSTCLLTPLFIHFVLPATEALRLLLPDYPRVTIRCSCLCKPSHQSRSSKAQSHGRFGLVRLRLMTAT